MRRLPLVVLLVSATVMSQMQPHRDTTTSHIATPSSDRAEPRPRSDDATGRIDGVSFVSAARNWSQTLSTKLVARSRNTLTLAPCPVGIDTSSGVGYDIHISDGASSETVAVAGGSCTSGASGTVVFTPYFSHPLSSFYTVESASSGIQETINAECGMSPTTYQNNQCNVTIPANGPQSGVNHTLNTYNVYGTIFLHSNQSVLSGYGASLNCLGRSRCLQIGDLVGSNDFVGMTVEGLSFRSPINFSSNPSYAGLSITQAQKSSRVVTITTASAHGFRVGDMVTIMFTDNNAFWGDAVVTAAPSATTFQYAHSGADIAPQTTPGVVALAYTAILDNGGYTRLMNISYDKVGEAGSFNNFFDFWDDENATVDHFAATTNLTGNINWTGSFIFSAGNQGALNQIAPVITFRDSSITAINPCATVYNSNGLYIENVVCQSSGPWQFYAANSTGNYQGAYLKNIYSETGNGANPPCSKYPLSCSAARSPFPGTGIAGLIAGSASGAASFSIKGSGGTEGMPAGGGSGSILYSYFIVARDCSGGTWSGSPETCSSGAVTQTSPMQVLNYGSTGRESIPVLWPRVANGTDGIIYDVLRTTTPVGVSAVYPYYGGCNGGSTTSCGAVATGVAQCSTLVCSYTDTGSAVTSPYTVAQGSYAGNLVFWPGSIVAVNKSVLVDSEEMGVVGVGLSNNAVQIAGQCTSYGAASPGGYTSCLGSITSPNNGVPSQTATLMTDGGAAGGGQTLAKGRLNFGTSPYASLQPHHIITLVDAQPALTRATWGYRPPANAHDVWIGTDVPSGWVGLAQGQLAFGAPVAMTDYIGGVGDGKKQDWKERLTAEQKTFAVPVRIEKGNSLTLGDGSPLTRIKSYTFNQVATTRVPPQGCVDIVAKAAGITKSDQIAGTTPPAPLRNLSLNTYPADVDEIILHFCNPSTSEEFAPPGAYSFLAVR